MCPHAPLLTSDKRIKKTPTGKTRHEVGIFGKGKGKGKSKTRGWAAGAPRTVIQSSKRLRSKKKARTKKGKSEDGQGYDVIPLTSRTVHLGKKPPGCHM